MAEQLDIFGNAVPFPPMEPRGVRRGERGGSVEAAKVPDDPKHYVDLLHILAGVNRPVCDDDLCRYFPRMHPGTLSKRRLRLERAGLVEVVEGQTAKTRHGSEAMTFRITDKGRQVLNGWRRT